MKPAVKVLGKHRSIQPETATEPNKPQHGNMSEMSRIVLEASRMATEKMLDYYKRMGIRVTAQMTLAPEPEPKPKRSRRSKKD
jgi:hypothetical protein